MIAVDKQKTKASNMKKPIALITLVAVLAVAAFQFIRLSNDHRECEEKVAKWKNATGETVTEKRHVCKEQFSF